MAKLNKNLLFLIVALVASSAVWLGTQDATRDSMNRLLQSGTYATSTTRLQGVNDACVGKDRNAMISASAQAESDSYKAQIATTFSIDGNAFVVGLINNKSDESLKMITDDIKPWVFYIGPFAVGLVLILILWPFLCCCCLCPSCCPSKCCQKREEEPYTKCELIWPSVVLTIALLLACVSSIVGILFTKLGFTRATSLSNGISNVACSSFILIDDFLNGNVTTSRTNFFIGVNPLITQLNLLNGTINNINTDLNTLGTGGSFMVPTRQKITDAIVDVSKIPNNVVNGSLSLTYSTPIDSSAPGGTLTSTFVTELGRQTVTTSLVGGMAQALKSMDSSLGTIATNVDTFSGSIAGFKSNLDSTQDTISSFQVTLNDFGNTATDYNKQIATYTNYINIGISVFFGVVIGLTVVAIIAMILMTFCDKFKCRYLIYFACVILFIIGIIGFLLATIFSVIVPVVYLGCEFLTFSLSSPNNFRQNFNSVIDAQTSGYITVCFSTQSGDIISQVAPSLKTTLGSLTTSISDVNTFNSSSFNTQLTGAFNLIGTRIDQVLNSDTSDLDSSQITILQKLSYATNYSSCADPEFVMDSWVPSVAPIQTYVPCQISGGNAVTSCSNFPTTTGGCQGCMDTTKLLDSQPSGAAATAYLLTRYQGCTTFSTALGNAHGNYYINKKTALTGVKNRFTTTNTKVNAVISDTVTTIPNKFTSIINQLKTTASTITDPQYGLVAGLNCKVIGEDIVRVSNVFCLEAFNNFYFLRLVIGIASFGILFAMCCTICAGVRHYKHSERIGKINQTIGNQPNTYGTQNTNAQFNLKY